VFDTVLDLFSIQSTGFDKAGSFVRKRRAMTPDAERVAGPAAVQSRN